MEADQKPAAPDGSPSAAQGADYNNDEGHATDRCFRCLLLVMCTHPFAKEALTLHLTRGEGHKRYFNCNLMYRNVLASSYQHLMAEAPADRRNPRGGET